MLCSFILPDVTKYDTKECFDVTKSANDSNESNSDENDQIKCNEAVSMLR